MQNSIHAKLSKLNCSIGIVRSPVEIASAMAGPGGKPFSAAVTALSRISRALSWDMVTAVDRRSPASAGQPGSIVVGNATSARWERLRPA